VQRSPRAYVHKKPGPTTQAREWCSCCRSKKVSPTSLTSEDASDNEDAGRLEYFVRHKGIPMFGRFLSSSKVNNCDSRMVNPRLHNSNVEMRGFNVLSLEPYSMSIDNDTEDTQIILHASGDSNGGHSKQGLTLEVTEECLNVIPDTSTNNTGASLHCETESLLSRSQVE
jgi:hypothetical protein